MKKYIPIISLLLIFSCKSKSKDTNTTTVEDKPATTTTTPAVVASKEALEKEIITIITALKNKDAKILNSYIDTTVGFYLIPANGVQLHFEKWDSINFSDPYISYYNFGDKALTNYAIKYEPKPVYSCEDYKWNKYGLFVDDNMDSLFTTIMDRLKKYEEGISFPKEEVVRVKQIEKISQGVYLAEKEGDIVFGITYYGGRYILTFLNVSESNCDV